MVTAWLVFLLPFKQSKNIDDTFFYHVLGGMAVSQGYLMKLQTQMLRVCETPKTFVILNTHFPLIPYIFSMCIYTSCIYLFVVPRWLSVTSGCILALLQKVSSFHGSLFPHLTVSSTCLLKLDVEGFPLFTCCSHCLSMFSIVEQRGHDCWVFTGLKLVSRSFEMVVLLLFSCHLVAIEVWDWF